MSARAERQNGRPAFEITEEAVVLLRASPPGLWLCFYLGAIPFWIALLYFVTDMSRSAFAGQHLVSGSMLVALLYLWKKCWHAVVAGQWRVLLLGTVPPPWSVARVWRLVVAQAALQPWGLPLRAAAWFILLPAGWVAGYFQHLTAAGDAESAVMDAPAKRALRQTFLWPKQLHTLYGALSIFSLFVWLDVLLLLGGLPALLKTVTGIETMASRSFTAWAGSSTFSLVVLGLTLLLVEPLWKAAFVLRSFYGEALATGADLQARLKSIRALAMLVLAGGTLLLAAPAGRAAEAPLSPPAARDSARLDENIDRVLQRREYAWRLPRQAGAAEKASRPEWLKNFGVWLRSMGKKFHDWFRDRRTPSEREEGGMGELLPVREIVYVLLVVVSLVLVWACWLAWRQRGRPVEMAQAVEALPDLQSESVLANELPEEGWLRLMREMLERGDLRLALRAAYLGCLAQLGERQLVSIARHKSNRDYWQELRRRARAREGLLAAFSENLLAFEKVWYGRALISRAEVERFTANLERMRAC